MLNKLFFLSLILISSSFAEEVCKDGQIKYTEHQKEVIKNVKICKDSEGSIYSTNCSKLKCNFLKEPFKRPLDFRKYAGTMGSPGFKACRELKGSPQIIKYKFNGEKYWLDDARCIVDKKTFVSNAIILEVWKSYILD
ncbi:hypothetical protein BIY24_10320 [Halobacteriovorax marinus]|uniref:Lipoprotein n=1 Tax=Halobacteriovorax marinus (strain ATCC BAA-682 / DSM 15412 / SJ) TaxID=862908 RepID=E1X3T0_HALMS|nr:hypothetical protein [Halobacteriovorax marinus]ATH08327.1 hypothetical protein BIY24_10320 [Halobacteriovorax marinus]CBW27009.1 hypothetical protein BMS_2205 [Halobacteriovorax marinus SJ]